MTDIYTYCEPAAVANYFLDCAQKDGEGLSQMKLHKLLFFAHGWYMAFYDKPLIRRDSIEAWRHGPIEPSLFYQFRHYGMQQITERALSQDGSVAKLPEGEEHDHMHALLDRVWEVYKRFTAMELSAITHEEDMPWSIVMREWREKGNHEAEPKNLVIPDEKIKEYFEQRRAENEAKE